MCGGVEGGCEGGGVCGGFCGGEGGGDCGGGLGGMDGGGGDGGGGKVAILVVTFAGSNDSIETPSADSRVSSSNWLIVATYSESFSSLLDTITGTMVMLPS